MSKMTTRNLIIAAVPLAGMAGLWIAGTNLTKIENAAIEMTGSDYALPHATPRFNNRSTMEAFKTLVANVMSSQTIEVNDDMAKIFVRETDCEKSDFSRPERTFKENGYEVTIDAQAYKSGMKAASVTFARNGSSRTLNAGCYSLK